MAPEVLESGLHDFKVDAWSFGIMLFVLLSGRFPFGGNEHTAKVEQGRIDAEVRGLPVSEDARSFLFGLLRLQAYGRDGRHSLERMRGHSWLAIEATPGRGLPSRPLESKRRRVDVIESKASPSKGVREPVEVLASREEPADMVGGFEPYPRCKLADSKMLASGHDGEAFENLARCVKIAQENKYGAFVILDNLLYFEREEQGTHDEFKKRLVEDGDAITYLKMSCAELTTTVTSASSALQGAYGRR